MKYMNVVKRFGTLNLQLFADGGEGDPDGDEGSDGEEEDVPDGDGDEDPEEKKFSQKDVDEAVKKRLARERRKWQRDQQKKKPDSQAKGAGDDDGEDEETKTLREKAEKADALELKWACLEHDVDKSCVDDVIALAKAHAAKDETMDIEDAIDEVLKKYPQFKDGGEDKDEEESDDDKTGKKSWGQRHGKGAKSKKTVDDEIREKLFGK